MRLFSSLSLTQSALAAWLLVAPAVAAEPDPHAYSLDIQVFADGLARVHAQVQLPGPLEAARFVLTDYDHWPDLFPPGLRLAAIRREAHGVITDFWAARHILPGELHLITETRESGPTRLETTLIEGDFHRYSRTWQLSSDATASRTTATLDMEVQPKGWVPAWLFTRFLRQDLEAHFLRLQAAVAARVRP